MLTRFLLTLIDPSCVAPAHPFAYLGDALIERALPSALNSFELQQSHFGLTGPRQYGLLIAGRMPLEPVLEDFRVPWPERVLAAQIRLATGPIRIYVAHVPPGTSNGGIKMETLESLYRGLGRRSAVPRVFCGDFNSPQGERSNGEVITWGQDVSREGKVRWRKVTGKRWDSAERRVLLGLKQFDLHDVYRALHGYRRQDYSW